VSAATDIRGLKRVCVDCGNRFYDMNKRPVVCPVCNTEFSLEAKVKSRKGRIAETVEPKKAPVANDETVEADDEDEKTTISLDEAADLEDDGEDDEDLGDLDGLADLDDEDLDDLDAVEDDDED